MRPFTSIITEETCRSNKGYHLEKCTTEGVFYVIMISIDKFCCDEDGKRQYHNRIETELTILYKFLDV